MGHYDSIYFQWIINENKGMRIGNYLRGLQINSVAIYGAGFLGEMLFWVLKNDGIAIEYFIDADDERYPKFIHGIPIIRPEETGVVDGKVDVIIITPYHFYHAISTNLKKYTKNITLSIEKIVLSIMEKGGDESYIL